MPNEQELENLRTWLNQYSSGYLLVTRYGRFLTPEYIQQIAESCDELEVEERKVYLNWSSREASPLDSEYESVLAIADVPNSRIRLEPTPLTFDEYMERSPGRLELVGGYLGSNIEEALNLLDITLETFGLLKVVCRAPKELWETALNQAYGSGAESP